MHRLSQCAARVPKAPVNHRCARSTRQRIAQFNRAFATSHYHHSDSDPNEPTIRWWTQKFPWSKQREPDTGVDDIKKALKEKIDGLEEELAEMRGEGKSGKTLIEDLLIDLPKEDQDMVRAEILQDQQRKNREQQALAKLQDSLEIKWSLPPQQNTYLKNLNIHIRNAAIIKHQDQAQRKNLWHSYARCKAFVPSFLDQISDRTWTFLWTTWAAASIVEDPHWASHFVALSDDMKQTGKVLAPMQELLYIEALSQEGDQDAALTQWQNLRDRLGDDKRTLAEYELLGVRLFTSQGDPYKAEEIALKHMDNGAQEDLRMLIPIMRTWIERGDETGWKHAWILYLRLKTQLGTDITMEDYDNVTMTFLNGGRTDLALAVFKDMMLTGQETDQSSVELYRKSLGLAGKLQASAISKSDINKISLSALTILPKKYQNKFFYGSWLRKLLSGGNRKEAAAVIELMLERGVRPDPEHLNGLLISWLHAGNDQDKDKAEKMAWAMIHERIDFVKRRRRGVAPKTSASVDVSRFKFPPHLRRTVAPATIKTFALLLQYYGRRGMEEEVQLMQDCLPVAEIMPNHYFINELMYIDLRRGQHQAAWIKYQKMFRKVRPNINTFECLWECEKAHLDALVIYNKDRFPGPRAVMCDMMSWYCAQSPKERQLIRVGFAQQMYNIIIRCFCIAKDLEGILVAAYALKNSFGCYPDRDTARMVSIYVARLGIGEPTGPAGKGSARSRYKKNPQRKANVAKATRIFEIIHEQRQEVLAEYGMDDWEELGEEIQREEGLYILAEFLRTILRRTTAEGEDVEANIERVAWDMGVGGIRMDDPLPYDLEKVQ